MKVMYMNSTDTHHISTPQDKLLTLMASMSLPVVAAPMFLVSGPDLVLAACRNGVMGSFPFPNARTLEELEAWLKTVTATLALWKKEQPEAKIAPFAANMVAHSSYDRLAAELELVAKYQPPIVITALGSPKPVVDVVHQYGGLVFADVNSVTYAEKALSAGADGLVLVTSGAGGHTGHMSPLAFVTAVRTFFDGPLIVGGSISTGAAVRAVEILGANLAYIGTSFIAANESIASSDYKDMLLAAEYEDLILTNALSGANAYYLKESLIRMGLDPNNPGSKDGPNFAGSQQKINAWRDVWSAGHGVGTVKKIEPVANIVARIEAEYKAAVARPSFLK
ncbi:NAD(P)H-dependent flavin oxidoreductase [Kordiimonas pumila]|uniref:NAD(P)H-dependent flavin oxidoreductase n=1 Tax=Kordiimonas pumila TaxID=2161677 RepID=A0ABV7D6I4_9PROT|nr:nitronate monooxygenase [Kordiimonas pumila]